MEFSNKRQKVELKVVKEDVETGKKLEGAEFGIYNNNDIYSGDKVIVKADTLLQKVKSDKMDWHRLPWTCRLASIM